MSAEPKVRGSLLGKLPFPEWMRQRFSDTQRYLIIWVVTGVACGLAAVLFHQAIDLLWKGVRSLAGSWGDSWQHYALLGLAPMTGGLVTGFLLHRFAPSAAGSGIPQTKARYYRDFGVFQFREAVWRFILGTVSVGMGMSLGREGPTVHLCAAIASKIGQLFGIAKKRVQAMVPLGMGAGIAAAFNTPMAAVFFVFEELLGDFSSKSFFGIFICVVIAATINRLLLGEHPAFDIELGLIETNWWMLLCLPLGLLAAVFGRAFVASLLWARRQVRESRFPVWLRPAGGGLGVGLIGVAVMLVTDGRLGIFGIGYDDADEVLNGRLLLGGVVALLLVGKFFATIIAYASGGSGGLFAPTLFMGAMLGGLVGIAGQSLFGLEDQIVGAMALLGMGAVFAAIIRCPMTSIVIIWEMTGQYALILPLMVGNMLAWLLSSRLQALPLYDALLLQDKISLRRLPHYQGDQDWRNLPVSSIMTFDVVSVERTEAVAEAVARLVDGGCKHHAYPVCDASGALVGMITHHEMVEAARARPDQSVEEARRDPRKLVLAHPEDSIRDVAQILVLEDVMQVPVVSRKQPDRIVGLVTLHDIARQQNAIDQAIGR
jgi:chloride channel protein, CIC family